MPGDPVQTSETSGGTAIAEPSAPSADDTYLSSLGPTDDDDPSAEPAPSTPRRTEPKQPKADPDDDGPEAGDAGDAGDEDGGRSPPGAAKGDDIKRAMRALQRDGVPADTLEQLAKQNPRALTDWGLQRAKSQAEGDALGNKIKDLEAKLAEKDTGKKPDSGEAEPGEAFDLSAALEPFTRQFDIEGKALAEPVSKYVESAVAKAMAPLGQLTQGLSLIGKILEDHLTQYERGRQTERYPDLADDENFAKVRAEMDTLAKTGRYKSVGDLMRAAALVALGDEMVSKAAAEAGRIEAARANGKPSSATKPPATQGKRAKNDTYDDRWLRARQSGKSVEEANRYAASTEP